MKIWVDADSCPVKIRHIICKAGKRTGLLVIFVANRCIPLPRLESIKMIITENVDQSADNYIVENSDNFDLVITRDIPLAKRLVEKGLLVINDRGTFFTKDNINTLLSARNFNYELQANGLMPEKTNTFGKKEIQKFSQLLDTLLTKMIHKKQNSK